MPLIINTNMSESLFKLFKSPFLKYDVPNTIKTFKSGIKSTKTYLKMNLLTQTIFKLTNSGNVVSMLLALGHLPIFKTSRVSFKLANASTEKFDFILCSSSSFNLPDFKK